MNESVIVALPNAGGYLLASAWFPREKPGDVGGVTIESAATYLGQVVYPSLEAAQAAWRIRTGR